MLACELYEYARESNAVRSEIASARKQIEEKTGQIKFGPRVNQFQSFILMSLSIPVGFPQTPWVNLEDKEKQKLLKMMAGTQQMLRYIYTANNPPLSFVTNEPGETTLDVWNQKIRSRITPAKANEKIVTGFFRVNLEYGHALLIQEFAEHLRRFEGKSMVEYPPAVHKKFKKPPGRRSTRDKLNALAAMRLRYYCDTFREAQKKLSKKIILTLRGSAFLFICIGIALIEPAQTPQNISEYSLAGLTLKSQFTTQKAGEPGTHK